MATELLPEERETHLSMAGDNRTEWEVFSDDPYWIRRFEKLGVAPVEVVGTGFKYKIRSDQVLIRKGKREVSEEQRERMRRNNPFGNKNTSPAEEIDTGTLG